MVKSNKYKVIFECTGLDINMFSSISKNLIIAY